MMRGNGKQILFEDDADRDYYLTRLYFCLKDERIVTLAWCLMDNHVHLLVRDENTRLPTAMARVNGAYARHFNKKYDHVGHVFQDRYRCEPIDDESYLLETVRYIHNNPEEAGICRSEKYRWSSYREYMGSPRLVDTHFMLTLFGGRAKFKRFCREKSNPTVRLNWTYSPTTETLIDIASDVISPVSPDSVAALPRDKRNRCLRMLRDAGFTVRQIVRLTGVGKTAIIDATRPDASEA
jgi:REP element-mobilizing transposase RayT